MNQFVKLRKSIENYEKTYDFTQVLLKNYTNPESENLEEENLFKNRLNFIKEVNDEKISEEKELLKL